MSTPVLRVDAERPDPAALRRAAEVIRAGGLVAFPTETVYGLGANALDAAAVARIFAAKGRPATNPVIVHVADADQVRDVAAQWPAAAARLAARFWPGPLTLVVPRRPEVPDVVTAGGPTVALRCPAHVVARELIWEAGVPVAAPSANRSTELSPTRAEHVLKGLDARIDLILDAGPCPRGIESTVADVTGGAVRVLRPGPITAAMLEEVVGRVEAASRDREAGGVARSPGQMTKHYSPRAPLVLATTNEAAFAIGQELSREERSWGWLSFGEQDEPFPAIPLPADPERYAARLYDELHRFDQVDIDRIVVTLPPDTPEWTAVRDRLTRAAAIGPSEPEA
jgi:L-threonylcarbamoyladenylate synthase